MTGHFRKMFRQHATRFPQFISLALFILLCASVAYWGMQFVRPTSRKIAAPLQVDAPQFDISQAAKLFGGDAMVESTASNYQLLGVVVAQNEAESVAILSADGKPAQSLRIGKEVGPGASIKEIHRTYVLVSEGGIPKRLVLPEHAQISADAVAPVSQEKTRD